MGQRLIQYKKSFIGLSTDFVIKRISALTADRISKVQMSAREALRIWKKLQKQYDDIEKKKMRVKFQVHDNDKLVQMNMDDSLEDNPGEPQPEQPSKQLADDSLEERTFSSKQNSIARGADVFKSNNLVEKTHLKQRAHNFVKKRTGTGGGFITEFDQKEKDRKKSSFNVMRENFKSQVYQDKMNYSRKRNRNKYESNDMQSEDSMDRADPHRMEREAYEEEEMDAIEEDPEEVKESMVVAPQAMPPKTVRANRPPVVEEAPPKGERTPVDVRLVAAEEEERVPTVESTVVGMEYEPAPLPSRKEMKRSRSAKSDKTLKYDSDEDEVYDDKTMMMSKVSDHTESKMTSTVYYGGPNTKQNELIEYHDYDDKTVRCDSTDDINDSDSVNEVLEF
jgi:hypothetical protein